MRQNTLALGFVYLLTLSGCSRSPQHYTDKGNNLFADGNYEDASLNYRKVIQQDPNHGEAHYRLGLTELKRELVQEAHTALLRAVDLQPDNQDAKVKLGDLCFQAYLANPQRSKSFYDCAVRMSDQLLAKNSGSYDGLRLKGHLALSERRNADAVRFYRRADEAKPFQGEVILRLAQALAQNGQLSEAEALALQLIEKDKSFGEIYDLLYELYRVSGRIQDAENIFKEKVRNNPKEQTYALQLAAHYVNHGKSNESSTVLQGLLDDTQDFPRARMAVGNFYMSLRNYPEARHHFDEGARANPKERIEYQKRLMAAFVAEGNRDAAAGIAEQILREQPDDMEALAARASIWLDSDDAVKLDAGIRELEALSAKSRENGFFRYLLGHAYRKKGNLETAAVHFGEASRSRINPVAPRLALAEIAGARQQYQNVLQYADGVLALDSANARARVLKAIGLSGTKQFAAARTELSRLLRESPENRDAQLQLGLVQLAEKNFSQAESTLLKLHQPGQDDIRPLVGLVQLYTVQKRLDKALQIAEESLRTSPDSNRLQAFYAGTALNVGRYDVAIRQFEQLIASSPKSADYHFLVAQAYRSKGDLNSAINSLQRVENLTPNDAARLSVFAYTLEAAGRKEEAKAKYRRVLALRPDDAGMLNNLGYLMAETGDDLDEALKLVQRAVQKKPDEPAFSDSLAWIYLKKGMPDKAIQIFSPLSAKYPKDAAVRMRLAQALIQKGDKARAKTELRAALANQPSKEIEAQVRTLLGKIE